MVALRRAAGVQAGRLTDHQHRRVGQKPGHGLLVGARHLVKAGRQMNIGIVAQRGVRPGGQIRHGQMDHHGAGGVSKACQLEVKGRSRAGQPRQGRGGHIGDHCAVGGDDAAIGQLDSLRPTVLMQHAGDTGICLYHRAACGQRRSQRPDDGVRAALADHHAKGLRRHPLEIGEKRTAGDIGRKIQMHAPGRQHRLHLGRAKGLSKMLARRLQQKAQQIKRARDPFGAKCFEPKICKRTQIHRAA